MNPTASAAESEQQVRGLNRRAVRVERDLRLQQPMIASVQVARDGVRGEGGGFAYVCDFATIVAVSNVVLFESQLGTGPARSQKECQDWRAGAARGKVRAFKHCQHNWHAATCDASIHELINSHSSQTLC